jgi:hypothetical protein
MFKRTLTNKNLYKTLDINIDFINQTKNMTKIEPNEKPQYFCVMLMNSIEDG